MRIGPSGFRRWRGRCDEGREPAPDGSRPGPARGVDVLSVDLHLDFARLNFDAFWYSDGENAVFEFCSDAIAIGVLRQSEAAGELAVAAFDEVVSGGVGFLFELPFAFEGEDAVADGDFNVRRGDVRQFCADVVAGFIFEDVHRRRPIAVFAVVVAEECVGDGEEAAGDAEFTEWVVGVHGNGGLDLGGGPGCWAG